MGADVTVDDGALVVKSRTAPDQLERCELKTLLAFAMPPPKSPEEALACFRVAPGFRIELVAAEPEVVDPVAFDWGPDGRLWVVEMRDYPLGMDGKGKPGGVVKWLTDSDGDGRFEKAVAFLEGLPTPTGVMPWRDGVLIAAAPDVIFAADTDGDGRADRKEVILTGFGTGTQHRFNGFEYGLDGWVYLANGDSGGTVRSLKSGRSLNISGRDVRFHPDTGALETVSACTQYGLRRDDWGHWFGNNNPTWLWHVPVPEHYLRRNSKLAMKSVKHVLANYENSTRVFPASTPIERTNQPWSLNHVTSACSPCPYRDELFGSEFACSIFICEPVHNVVHREVLVPEGSTFRSRRAPGDETSEFLASTDHWCRPVMAKTGPDGALYVADMYRFVLEHPEWISPEMEARLDLRAGEDKGRLYRVVPANSPRRKIPGLSRMTTKELVSALDSPSGWQRDMAQRLLVERREATAGPLLRALLTPAHAPQVRVQVLATLGLLGVITPDDVKATLRDPHPAVRSHALQQSERFAAAGDDLFHAVSEAAADSDAEVRMHAAFSLGAWPPTLAEPVLERMAAAGGADEWLRAAILSSLHPDRPLFSHLNKKEAAPVVAVPLPVLKPTSADRASVIASYSGAAKLTGDPNRGAVHFRTLCATCHRHRGEGTAAGPDLGMVASKPLDWLLSALLDPNQAVEARYRAWQLTRKSGEPLAGLITAETANNITLRVPGGIDHAVLRTDIVSLAPLGASLMPAGFESALKPQDMADLIAWIKEAGTP